MTEPLLFVLKTCTTCKRAEKWLQDRHIAYRPIPIRETPPSREQLKSMLEALDGNLRALFNTSGRDYRAMGLSGKLPEMSTDEALDLLAGNGNLIKRPFLLTPNGGAVGFREERWRKLFGETA